MIKINYGIWLEFQRNWKFPLRFLFSSFLLNANFSERNRPETRSIDHFECDESRQTEAFRRQWLIWGFRSVRWFESNRLIGTWSMESGLVPQSRSPSIASRWSRSHLARSSRTLVGGIEHFAIVSHFEWRPTHLLARTSHGDSDNEIHQFMVSQNEQSHNLRTGQASRRPVNNRRSLRSHEQPNNNQWMLFKFGAVFFRLLLFSALLSSRLVLWIFFFLIVDNFACEQNLPKRKWLTETDDDDDQVNAAATTTMLRQQLNNKRKTK